MELKDDARQFKALADQTRLSILLALQHGEKCGCELTEELGIAQPTLSHHMRILCESTLVKSRKEGKWMHYSISSEGAGAFCALMARYARCDCEQNEAAEKLSCALALRARSDQCRKCRNKEERAL